MTNSIAGCLLGTAVGDALGLPYEGLSAKRAVKLYGAPDRYRLLLGRGMISDDTEHTCLVAQSLIESGMDVDRFRKSFSKRLRWWILGLPAGTGKATAIACLKLWLGYQPPRSGVYSAGNGPAMRAAIFGAVCDDLEQMIELVTASTEVTHSDPKALHGAIAVALLAKRLRQSSGSFDHRTYQRQLSSLLDSQSRDFQGLIGQAIQSSTNGQTPAEFATSIGQNQSVSGYVYHTVAVAIQACLRYPKQPIEACQAAILCGGDADTVAAIVGGIVGSSAGEEAIDEKWIQGICEWPMSTQWIRKLGYKLEEQNMKQQPATAPETVFLFRLARNLLFLTVVLFHGLRRLSPI